MIEEKPNASKASAIFLASLFVVAMNAYLIGKLGSFEFFKPDKFSAFYLFFGLVSGFVITYGFANFVLKEKYREKLLSDAITDPVTGLYTRHYMNEVAPRFIHLHKRNPEAGFALSLIELVDDNNNSALSKKFVKQAMSSLATLVMEKIRETDIAVQYSSRQIAVFSTCAEPAQAEITLKRIIDEISAHPVNVDESNVLLTVRSVQAIHLVDETMSQLLNRAEEALRDAEWQAD